MSKFENFVRMKAEYAAFEATKLLFKIKQRRAEELEGAIKQAMKEPRKVTERINWFSTDEKTLPPPATREEALDELKKTSHWYIGSPYNNIMARWINLEEECHDIIEASKHLGIEDMCISMSTVAKFNNFGKQQSLSEGEI